MRRPLVSREEPVRAPIRAELFSIERLEEHARSLAEAEEATPRRGRWRPLSRRLTENGEVLLDCYRELAQAIREESMPPAAGWLVDNFHVVEDQLREVRDSLPPSYYHELPKIGSGHLAGQPRVYGIAWAYVSHLDSRFDPEGLRRFVAAYQEVEPLTIGELWAVGISLRVVLLENLRRLAELIVRTRALHRAADEIADGILEVGEGRLESVLPELRRIDEEGLHSPFVVQLLQRLRDRDPDLTPGLAWLLERLAVAGTTTDEVVNEAHQEQAATNVSVRNVITSLRQIASFDWTEFVESVSLVDKALTAGSTYADMSLATRDRYRHAVEDLSRGSGKPELDVAEQVLAFTDAHPTDAHEGDPGYYLIAAGRPLIERELRYRAGPLRTIGRAFKRRAAIAYLGSIALLAGLILALPIAATVGRSGGWAAVLGLLALVPASDLAVAIVNRATAALVRPFALPSLELRYGPTEELRTMVAVPTMLARLEQVGQLVERLEVHYLANSEGDFHFALLTDWPDAEAAEMPGDDALLAAAIEGVAQLNRRYGPAPGGTDRFLIFHRRRLLNEAEGRYMGWERKRGKLHELNRLLRGAADTTFVPTGSIPPEGVRYVITLDADSRLPPGAATQLVATIAHPLNRARLDERLGRVVEGYGVLQPRVVPFLVAGSASLYQQAFSPPAGVDPYASAVSDVYQDLFGEGSYAGKGIYEIDAFEASLRDRVPENSMLSHDLFEGTFARAGLVTNVEVFEEYPSHYEVAAARMHRWVRGDWQLLPWIVGRHGPLPGIARFKMADNLRRSLSPPAALLTLVVSWMVPRVPAWPWTGLILASIALPSLLPILERLIPRRTTTPGAVRLRRFSADTAWAFGRIGVVLAMLPDQAILMANGIAVTMWRLLISRRRLLTWVTAEEAERRLDTNLVGFARRMAPAVTGALVAAGAVAVLRPGALPIALPFCGLWACAPLVAYGVSRPRPEAVGEPITDGEVEDLRLVARRTWGFFERFVTADDNWLPPDNFQEDPEALAHRTSPTNIGLYLLSVLAAREFGWIGTSETIERLQTTLSAVRRLESFQGHLFNWYDTATLQPLAPLYVSTVDSGNLAGHLLAVSQGCLRLIEQPPGMGALAGIRDAALLVQQEAVRAAATTATQVVSYGDLDRAVDELLASLQSADGGSWPARLQEIGPLAETVADIALTLATGPDGVDLTRWATALVGTVESHRRDLDGAQARPGLSTRLASLADSAGALSRDMHFGFLLDPTNKLLSVGYRMADSALDQSHYDLLASEARLASYVGVAKGDLPPAHWFHLGRPMTPLGSGAALISWSGSMFEYLMPLLVMRSPQGSVLDATYRAVVRRQIEYGTERQVPWGISEAAFGARDVRLTYQYSAFGVPGLGFERGLSEDLVVAPYATMLAAMVEPRASLENLNRLRDLGASGRFGYYESLDFTPARRPEDGGPVLVRAYMAHHQGMSVVALANVLFDGVIRDLFHAEPSVRAAELLLHERVPRDVEVARPRAEEVAAAAHPWEEAEGVVRRITSPHGSVPATHLLSNGRYSVMLTAAGSGYSRLGGLAITRWREDATRDNFGSYLFVKDEQTGHTWSAGYQPTRAEPDSYEVNFTEGKAEIIRRDGPVATTLEVVVSTEDDAEVRRVTVTNLSTVEREVEVTSYAELVLALPRADEAHPTFSNLFVQTEAVEGRDALLATRRPRSAEEEPLWAGHVVAVSGDVVGGLQYATDRARFLGRGRQVLDAGGLDRPLSNSAGTVLDPIFALRRRVRLQPGGTAHLSFTTLVARSRTEALDLVDKFSDPAAYERSLTLAWTQGQVRLHHLGIDPERAHVYQQLAGALLYPDPAMRAPSATLAQAVGGQQGLWRYSISGDLPIVLVRIDEREDRAIVRELLHAQEYWRMKNLSADLVIINEKPGSYAQDLQATIEEMVRASGRGVGEDPAGGVFILKGDLLTREERSLLQAAARAVLLSRHGTLVDHLARRPRNVPAIVPMRKRPTPSEEPGGPQPRLDLEFWNGLGGFAAGGAEYVVMLGEGQWTPTPWINVVANPGFGFCVSESGSGYTWAGNSRENQLTPWSNDPVADPPGEVLYVRDEDTGEVWGPTALPIRDPTSRYLARHGPGYSEFEHTSRGIALNLWQTVPLEDPVKVSRLRLRNLSGRRRRLSVTAYAEWVLGSSRPASSLHIRTERDDQTGALLARNPWNPDFPGWVAFADLGGGEVAWTTDRAEFLGRHGSLDRPAALTRRARLSEREGAGLDPCAALQRTIVLPPDGEADVVFLLGAGEDVEAVRSVVRRYRSADLDDLRRGVSTRWNDVMGTIQVRTPDRSFDLMLNHRLLYQTVACRILGRAAFYQAGGAFGFRDQLQDVMAVVVSQRDLAREHLLRAAARQFEEGDVQHWWHAESGKGVRTRISDDYLWLPYAVAHYVEATGDLTVLDETVPFLKGAELQAGADEAYFTPTVSARAATVFEHCRIALERARLRLGSHSLPLIGTGDWNDGFNRVGREGLGESVWLGWFLDANLRRFADLADDRNENELAETWRQSAAELRASLEAWAWDGDWYLRAFLDDGTPLGSSASPECRIDSISQSWSVIHAGAQPERAQRAMAAVEEYLVRPRDGLVLLFTPPFDRWEIDPGYIKGYSPGVRENGGQYTHGAIWCVIAYAALGDGDRAGELFSILNPINHASNRAGIHRYRVEPYVAAADVYSEPPHVGRGGWTWYTGAAGWMYRAGVEWILGFRLHGDRLRIDPCIPRAWRSFHISFRYHSALFEIQVENPDGATRGVSTLTVDGVDVPPGSDVELIDDGATHRVLVVLDGQVSPGDQQI